MPGVCRTPARPLASVSIRVPARVGAARPCSTKAVLVGGWCRCARSRHGAQGGRGVLLVFMRVSLSQSPEPAERGRGRKVDVKPCGWVLGELAEPSRAPGTAMAACPGALQGAEPSTAPGTH